MRRPVSRFFKPSRRGVVLIIIMWIALGLVSLALYFSNTISFEYRAADNSAAGLQAEQAIEGARRYLTTMLTNFDNAGVAPSVSDGDYVAENVPIGSSNFWLLGRDPNTAANSTTPVYGLVDEASKLNLNNATQEMLELLPGMTTDLAAAIIDWRDDDDDLSSGGAESQDYLTLDEAYSAKNSDFETPEELRLVQGITPTILYGEDVNHNGILDPNEDDGDASWPPDDEDGQLDAGLLEYVTTFTREPNTDADGNPRTDIHSQESLRTLFGNTIGQTRGDAIISAIGTNNFRNLNSPLQLYYEGSMTADEFKQVENSLTVSSGDYIVGRVNVSTAPLAVLACLPGMDEATAEQLIATRQGKDTEDLKSVIWVTEVLDQTVAEEIGPYITGQSYQFSADIVATGHSGHGFRRSWMVFDVEDEVRVIYRRDQTRSGWPLGKTTEQSSTTAMERQDTLK